MLLRVGRGGAQDLNCTVEWGRLGFRDSWRRTPSSILLRLLHSWQIPGVGAAPPLRLLGGSSASGAGSAAGYSSSKQGLLARLDDSVDEEVLAADPTLDDPRGHINGSNLGGGSSSPTAQTGSDCSRDTARCASEVLGAPPPQCTALAAGEQEGSSAFNEGAARGAQLHLLQELADVASSSSSSATAVSASSDQLWLPKSKSSSSLATASDPADEHPHAESSTLAEGLPVQQPSADRIRDVSMLDSGCSSDTDSRWQDSARSSSSCSVSPPHRLQADAAHNQAADALQWCSAAPQWPSSPRGTAMPCTASYDERWSEASQ